ncbi:hypothetical protein H9L15_05600 [Sphingomonas daechungensis]|uniref:Acyl carrier protein n=1 Tax=Sphingomonas daechungensis TaxID=1176646 RepID=A0ABX6T2F8_9SPHN|nr:hypothetical protein H9L15_05600 [Sphingomonas daechungensis]
MERKTEKRPILLTDRLSEDLWLDGMEIADIALQLEAELGRKPSAEAYSRVFTVSDFVAAFEEAPSLR